MQLNTILQPYLLYPKRLEKHVKGDCTHPPTSNIAINTLACKGLYDKLLALKNLPPLTCEKKLISYGIEPEDLIKVYIYYLLRLQKKSN